jgi:hypothetical protein
LALKKETLDKTWHKNTQVPFKEEEEVKDMVRNGHKVKKQAKMFKALKN